MYSFRKSALLLVLMIAVTNAAIGGTLPKDPCSLLTPAEVQTLDPSAKIASGVVDKSAAPLATQCSYTWGPRSDKWGDSVLQIMVIDVSKAYNGTSPDLLVQGVFFKAKAPNSNGSVISGVGDAAVFTYE